MRNIRIIRNMRIIATDAAPSPAGHYSQAIVDGGFVFVAGQLPIRAGHPPDPSLAIETQVERAFANVAAILAAAGSGLDQIVSTTIYVVGVERWSEVNAAYARIMGSHRPARTTVPVPALHHGFAVEVQVIARAGEQP